MSAATVQQCLSCLVAPLIQRRCASAAKLNSAHALRSIHSLIHSRSCLLVEAHSHSDITPAAVTCITQALLPCYTSSITPATSNTSTEHPALCMTQLTDAHVALTDLRCSWTVCVTGGVTCSNR
jgi:hypothetical protein